MSRETGEAKGKGKGKKRLAMKKVSVKDLQPKKEIKGGVEPVTGGKIKKL